MLSVAFGILLGSGFWLGRGELVAPTYAQDPQTSEKPGPATSASKPPDINVVIFLIDTLRADRLGVYGYCEHVTSPHIDALAQDGVVFDNAYAPSPWTLPTVASLFASTFPCEHNLLSKYDRLADSTDTLAERLKRAGYTTYSLYANAFINPEFGLHQGFDHHRGSGRNGGAKVSAALGPEPPQPFFFYIHNLEPHNPYHFAPSYTPGFRSVSKAQRNKMKLHFKEYKAAAEYDYREQRPLGTNDLTAKQDEHLGAFREMKDDWNVLYDASVRYADTHVGSTIKMLKARGFWDKTLFMLISDHGEEMDEHGGWLHDQSVYEELMRSPLIIRFPGDRFAGKRIKDVVSLVDLLPTICDYIGQPELAAGARGQSLMPLVRGETSRRSETFVVPGMRHNTTRYYRPWATTRGNINIMVRCEQWKGIWNADPDTFELYDLSIDPLERHNVAPTHTQLVAAMRDYAKAWYKHHQASGQEAEPAGELDEETLRNLRALGYVD